jgi:nucleoside-diphosphate-sugar epimerase
MKILVLGGSNFFGKKLVQRLINCGGHEVTVATRGSTKLEENVSSEVRQVSLDRTELNSMERALGTENFDLIYDQICFNPVQAKIATDVFSGRVKRYIFTSSMAVYDGSSDILEEYNFDTYHYPIDLTQNIYDYKEGKRQAEAYFHQFASFPVVSVRPPFVIGCDDKRFVFHINKILNVEPISILGSSTISFVSADEVADFLVHIGTNTDFAGPINANNSGFLNTVQLAIEIGKELEMTPVFDLNEETSPYCIEETLMISNELAKSTGFIFSPTTTVVGQLVAEAKKNRLGSFPISD